MPKVDNTERDRKITREYRKGLSIYEVGAAHALTPQRIQQILVDCNEPRRHQGERVHNRHALGGANK